MTGTAADLPALGIDIGGTKVAGGLVAPDGTILATARRATPGSSVSPVRSNQPAAPMPTPTSSPS